MAEVKTNLRVLNPSRKKPRPGDLFVMQLPDDSYLFGRVIDVNAVVLAPGAILIYLYGPRFETKEPPEPSELSPDRLLVAPIMTNQLPWSRGYFEAVAHWPLQPDDVLPQHCFSSPGRGYFDERGNRLREPVEPVGDYALHSFRTIDDRISRVLGFELAPD